MYRRLSEEQLNTLTEAAINEFGDKGYERANLGNIARTAGMSVGVIYKYYADKEALFLACVKHCLKALTEALKDVAFKSNDVKESIRSVIHTLIIHSREHQNINRMYHEITSGGARQFAAELAQEVEGISALVYTDLIRKAQCEHQCREDADAALFAFFFDNLFMMLQFSYSCDYYRERLKLYCGEDIFSEDGKVEEELTKFMLGAIGIKE